MFYSALQIHQKLLFLASPHSFCRGRRFLIYGVSKQFKSPQPVLSGIIEFASIHHELKAASLRIRNIVRTA